MQYLKIGKNNLLLGVMLILSITHLFGSYISLFSVIIAFALFSTALLLRNSPMTITPVDIAVCLVTLYELLLPFTSINTPPAYLHMMMGFYFFFSYFLFRLCLTSTDQFRTVLLFLSVAIFFILIVGTVSFFQFRDRVLESGFGSLYEFRHLLAPWGNANNMWTTFLIAFMGIILLAYFHWRRNKKAIVFLLPVFALLLWNCLGSFSRTTYILLALVFIVITITTFRNHSRKAGLLLGTFILTLVGFCTVNGTSDVASTLRLTATTSQQRSIDARYRDYSQIGTSLANNMMFGVGNGNCTLATSGALYENDDILYTNFVSSGFIQLITEKGIVGTTLWLILFLSILISLFKHRSPDTYLTAGIMILLALKETTFAVFADFPNLQCLFIIPIVGALNRHTHTFHTLSGKRLKYAYTPIAALFIAGFIAFAADSARNKENDDLIAGIETGKTAPETYLALPFRNTPHLINKASLLWESYLRTHDEAQCREAVHCLQQVITQNPLDNIPRFNLAQLYLHQGKLSEASAILRRLVENYPDNSLFRIGLAQLLSQQGKIPQSAEQYARAILINPQIMDDPEWKRLKDDNFQLFCYIRKNIYRNLPYSEQHPIQIAKNGKILWELGNIQLSDSLLRRAVTLLPNLGKAWYNLGIIAHAHQDYAGAKANFRKALLFTPDEHRLLDYVDGRGALASGTPTPERYYIHTRERIYYLKFRTWYKNKPYRNQIHISTLFGTSAVTPQR